MSARDYLEFFGSSDPTTKVISELLAVEEFKGMSSELKKELRKAKGSKSKIQKILETHDSQESIIKKVLNLLDSDKGNVSISRRSKVDAEKAKILKKREKKAAKKEAEEKAAFKKMMDDSNAAAAANTAALSAMAKAIADLAAKS